MYGLGIAQPLKYSYSADLLDLQHFKLRNYSKTNKIKFVPIYHLLQ